MSFLNYALRVFSIAFIVISFSACAQNNNSVGPIYTDPILKELSEITGKYLWNTEVKRHNFSKKHHIEKIISSRNSELVIHTLVNCLDNLTLSNSTIGGKKVALGVICYEALSQMAYYEPTTKEGDIAKDWPGYILPTATPDELLEAKHVWKKIVDLKAYIFL